jgi:antitoxin component YwqK of YwqJK toxin-antitoxin module
MDPPIITTNKELTRHKHIIAEKKIDDTTYYYYTEGDFYQTRNHEKAQKGYITVIKNLRYGKPIGTNVYLDGFGDTLIVDYRDKNNLSRWRIFYYGNKKIKSYYELKNGSQHGVSKNYYFNGNLQRETNWLYGSLHGKEINCYQNGQVESKGYNKNGNKNGLWIYFNEQGDTIRVENY